MTDLSAEQANFVRELYENGVAPSAVASIIQSMVSGQQLPAGALSPSQLYPNEKGVPISAGPGVVRDQRPMSEASLSMTVAPPQYTEMDCPM